MINTPVLICDGCGSLVYGAGSHYAKDGCAGPVRATEIKVTATHEIGKTEIEESRNNDDFVLSGETPMSPEALFSTVKTIYRKFDAPAQMVQLPSIKERKFRVDFDSYYRASTTKEKSRFQSGLNDAKNGQIDWSNHQEYESYRMGVMKYESR